MTDKAWFDVTVSVTTTTTRRMECSDSPEGLWAAVQAIEGGGAKVGEVRRLSPRNGGTLACGCWEHTLPGRSVGMDALCPDHGKTTLVKANATEPDDVFLSRIRG